VFVEGLKGISWHVEGLKGISWHIPVATRVIRYWSQHSYVMRGFSDSDAPITATLAYRIHKMNQFAPPATVRLAVRSRLDSPHSMQHATGILADVPDRPQPASLQLRQCFTQLRWAVCRLDVCEAKLVEAAVAYERIHNEATAIVNGQPYSQQLQWAQEAPVREACAAARHNMRLALEHACLVAPVLGVYPVAPAVPEFEVWYGTSDALLNKCGVEALSVWQWVMSVCLGGCCCMLCMLVMGLQHQMLRHARQCMDCGKA
jgi:hypothetical protein